MRNKQSGKCREHHFYYQKRCEIELVIDREEIFDTLKNLHSLCAEVFPCSNHVHICIKYHEIFLGFTLCEVCTKAIDCMSKLPIVIVNSRSGERYRLQVQLLK